MLVPASPTEALERATDPGEFVVLALERGKSWLAEALEHGDLERLVDVKGYAETLRVAVVQKQLGKDAELSAQELVRRAERCIAIGVREGQERGEVRTVGERAIRGNQHTGPLLDEKRSKPSQNDFLPHAAERTDAYVMADETSDDEFEQVLAEAKAERNLSRANVVSKIKPKPKASDRSEYHYKKRRIDPERVIEETVNMLEGLASGLQLLDAEDIAAIETEKRLAWVEAMNEPLRAINNLRKALKK